jgi:type II secretory pathway component PulF
MPVFSYKAINQNGKTVQEEVEAPNAQVVAEKLEKLGYLPLAISTKKAGLLNMTLFESKPKVKTDDIIVFTRQLVTLLKAGVPLLSCLDALSHQTENESVRKIIASLHTDIESGLSFSEALGKHHKVFDGLYINTIRAGELGGALDEVLDRLAELMEHDRETRSRIKSAMRYPLIVVVSITVAFVTLMLLVVPKFIGMFEKIGVDLPLPTRILIGIYTVISQGWYYLIAAGVIMVIAFKQWVKTESGNLLWDRFKLQAPIFGSLLLKTAMSRFTRMFETLNSSGLPILQTLDIVAKTVGNEVVAKEIEKVSLGIRRGEGIAVPLRQSKLFPPMVIQMISIGEQSGSLDEMLINVSKHYDIEVSYAVKNLTTMIEPILTVALGAIVLFLALAIFLPMWDLTKLAG